MSVRNLPRLLAPASVAVIGASDRPRSVGATVMRNLLAGGFRGPVVPVNPRHATVAGLRACARVDALDFVPDLAVVCTPAGTVPGIIGELGRKGTRAAIVLSAGLQHIRDDRGRTLSQAMLEEARPHLLRILGPNCVGLLVPGIGLNASFAHTGALPGSLAFISQSGALATALLDWSRSRGIGFSHFVSVGDCADVDFGDMLDYLAGDPGTSAILLYIEAVRSARKFMSAARAASRNKPVIVVKSGRVPEGARAAASHTGAMAGVDDVWDAAIRRAGMLRVDTVQELFSAAETLARSRALGGDGLAVLTNGGGAGVMAADALVHAGGRLARLRENTLADLHRLLPATWSGTNPVDIVGDAPEERYAAALDSLLRDGDVAAVLLIHAPTAIVDSGRIAQVCIPVARASGKPVLSCWLGGSAVQPARDAFAAAGLPAYDMPEQAVQAFLDRLAYQRNQALLAEIPESPPAETAADLPCARTIVARALAAGAGWLDDADARQVLAALGVPVAPTRIAGSVETAVEAAIGLGFPVVLKLRSPQVTHKSDVGGVALDLTSAQAVREAALAMQERLRVMRPDAMLTGFSVQPMVRRPHARELIAGLASDPVFGPIVVFGEGGTAVEVIADRAIALPPLNAALADDLVSRTRVSRLLRAYRDRPAADLPAVRDVLVRLAALAVEADAVAELDINPLLADEHGVLALDVRIRVAAPTSRPGARLAIAPYPAQLERSIDLAGTRLQLRPVRPEDAAALRDFIMSCHRDDLYPRFFGVLKYLPESQLARLTQIDYDREMAFLALDPAGHAVAEVRAVSDPDNENAEFAILVRSGWQGRGLGRTLLAHIVEYCRKRGIETLFGDVLASNVRMLGLAASLGFRRGSFGPGGVVRVHLPLHAG
ncbi:MAG TPA: bifunctional acetate--CoA ligase family protein/GNAT family N-acetyltransferase [Burkholderiales bacterium]|nr:bifunctional acetate--CoA ligase family protein/GNAT family N-acetyltransferase [Burkholderiales bacterium]